MSQRKVGTGIERVVLAPDGEVPVTKNVTEVDRVGNFPDIVLVE